MLVLLAERADTRNYTGERLQIINHGQRPWYWEGPPRGPST